MRLTDHIHLVASSEFGLSEGDCHVYAIDAGGSDDPSRLLANAADGGLDPARLGHVLLTHVHRDHTGGLAALRRPADAGPRRPFPHARQCRGGAPAGAWHARRTRPRPVRLEDRAVFPPASVAVCIGRRPGARYAIATCGCARSWFPDTIPAAPASSAGSTDCACCSPATCCSAEDSSAWATGRGHRTPRTEPRSRSSPDSTSTPCCPATASGRCAAGSSTSTARWRTSGDCGRPPICPDAAESNRRRCPK